LADTLHRTLEQPQRTQEQPKKAPEHPPIAIERVDLPELAETFADSIDHVFFDGQTLRINFGVTRFDQPQQAGSVNARRLPACRLVLTPGAAVELMNQIQQLTARMIQSGVLKPGAQAPVEKKTTER
jgi:hypothetical protein